MRRKEEFSRFSLTESIDDCRRLVLLGAGGAGMSALARMLVDRGRTFLAINDVESEALDHLRALGCTVHLGENPELLRAGDGLVLTDAVDLDSSLYVTEAARLGIPLFRRSQLLARLVNGRKCLCVTGTHGKTTTTAMIGAGLAAAGMDPLVIVGAEVPQFGGSVREGEGEWAVIEACEAYDALRDLHPDAVVLTNLEADHLDFHGTWENLLACVSDFVSRAPDAGFVFVGPSEGARQAAPEGQGYQASDWTGRLRLPGEHNRENAAGALAACRALGADPKLAQQGIEQFSGAERRLQVHREGAITVVDDYAHMPTEIRATLGALREQYPGRRLVAVFQPHLYTRTRDNIPEFAAALEGADFVVLTDIFPAREEPLPGVSAVLIAEKIGSIPHLYVPSRHHLPRRVAQVVREGDVVCGMGAGSISDFAPDFVKELDRPDLPTVLVFSGGEASEREVSIHSGNAVARAVEALGYPLLRMDPAELLNGKQSLEKLFGPGRPHCALLPIHGRGAEDGALQGLLELLHIPYCGSGVLASALTLDKQRTKDVLIQAGIDVPRGVQITRQNRHQAAELTQGFAEAVVKPNKEGSTVGLSFVTRMEDLPAAIDRALAYDESCLVEEWLKGVEISCPVLGDRALLPVEIQPREGSYDFANKYTPGRTEEPCPPPSLTEEQIEKSRQIALAVHKAMGCRGVTRTDMIVVGDRIAALEINTLPGMTPTSLVPLSARVCGMSFEQLVDWMIYHALEAQD